MAGFALIMAVAACLLAWATTHEGRTRVLAFKITGFATLAYCALFLWAWFVTGWGSPRVGKEIVQLGVLALYGIIYAFTPSGFLRFLGRRTWTPWLAGLLAGLMPVASFFASHYWGDEGHRVSEGMGKLDTLLFLSPLAMGEGVTGDGWVPHRFQIHQVALGVFALTVLALHLVPCERLRFRESDE